MSEKLKPFGAGVDVQITCWLGLRADITLKRPEGMGNAKFEKYLKMSRGACQDCEFRKKYLCDKLDSNGKASVDTMGEDLQLAEVALIKQKAPCVQAKDKVTVIEY